MTITKADYFSRIMNVASEYKMNKLEKFQVLGLNEKILKVLGEMHFVEPTEIQEKSIPLVLKGRDVIGKSATGSGKTLAFGCGIVENSLRGKGIQSLVLEPTRELAEQVAKSLRGFAKNYTLNVVEIYGGVSIIPQIENIKRADIIVGTPGRILDHLDRRTLNLDKVKILVLDEADRMVDMGFLPDVEKIIRLCPLERQTLMFSATLTTDINFMEKKYMKNAVHIGAESYVDPSKLKQIYYDISNEKKFSLLVHLLKQEKPGLVMVFCNTRRNADFLARNLGRYQLNAIAIHGGLSQNKRSRTMEEFKAGETTILICTDVAARGLDIKNVSHVYNYDMSKNSNEYIHRIGRTARAGKEGEAISLISNRDYENFSRVKDDDSLKIENASLPEFEVVNVRFSDNDGGDEGGNSGGYRPRSGGGYRGRPDGGYRSGPGGRGFSRGRSFGGGRGDSRGGGFSRGRDSRGGNSRGFSRDRRY